MDDPRQRHPSRAGTGEGGPRGPDVADAGLVGSLAAAQLRDVALFLERSTEAIRSSGEPPRQLLQSLADSAMHVRLTADAVEHLCSAMAEPDGPRSTPLVLVPES